MQQETHQLLSVTARSMKSMHCLQKSAFCGQYPLFDYAEFRETSGKCVLG